MFSGRKRIAGSVLHESDAHVVTRHFRSVVRTLLVNSLIATVVCLLFFRNAAYLAAIPIPVLLVVLLVTGYLEFRSRASILRSVGQEIITREEVEIDTATIGIVTLLGVIGVLAMATFVVAASIFNLQTVGAGAAILLLISLLIVGPYMPLYFSESERDELEKLKRERNHNGG